MMHGKNTNSQETANRIPSNTVGVELGVWKGESSARFLPKSKELHLVDSWSAQPYVEGDWDRCVDRYSKLVGGKTVKDFEKFYDKLYEKVVEKFSPYPNVFIYRMTTEDFFATFDKPVDWFYVDAAHDEEGVYNDLVNSFNHLKKHTQNGLIFGDDYGNKPGVVAGVDRFLKDHNLKMERYAINQFLIKL